jgi:hypothetical protein
MQVEDQLYKHEVVVLDDAAACQVFRQAAGLKDFLEDSLQSLEAAILKACGGLPLAAQLMGGQLYKIEDKGSWQVILVAARSCACKTWHSQLNLSDIP